MRVPGNIIMIVIIMCETINASHGMQVSAMAFLVEGATCANRGKLLHGSTHHSRMVPRMSPTQAGGSSIGQTYFQLEMLLIRRNNYGLVRVANQ